MLSARSVSSTGEGVLPHPHATENSSLARLSNPVPSRSPTYYKKKNACIYQEIICIQPTTGRWAATPGMAAARYDKTYLRKRRKSYVCGGGGGGTVVVVFYSPDCLHGPNQPARNSKTRTIYPPPAPCLGRRRYFFFDAAVVKIILENELVILFCHHCMHRFRLNPIQ